MRDELDQFIAQTRRHHATGFPNPERSDCPPPGQLTTQIWRGQLPNEVSRQHLLACSVCFNEYRTQLAAYQAAQPVAPNWWQQWLQGWRVKSALALTFIWLVSLGGWFVWQQARTPFQIQIAAKTEATAPVNMPSPDPRPPATAPTSKQVTSSAPPPPRALSPLTQAIDLNEYLTLRNVTGAEGKTMRLPAERIRLQLVLPEGSEKGRYTVRLVDAFGQALRRASAFSSTGQTLTVTLDLRSRPPQRYRLQISRGSDAPDYYPLTITEKSR